MKFIDLIGLRFSKLVPIKYVGKDKCGHSLWLCRCDCENEKIITGNKLRNNITRSCGCLKNTIKHGHSRRGKISKTYNVWHGIIQRCNNSNFKQYEDYGGRGITICERWLKFENFLEDVGEIPEGLTLDRTNNSGNYEPNNWRLITQKEQCRNKRNNIMVPYKGKNILLMDYCKIKNLNYNTIRGRICRGWPIEKALTSKIRICQEGK